MTSKLFPTRRHSPCPVCDDESGKCRLHSNDEIVLCMNYADAAKFEPIGEYKCIKPSNQSKSGDWATFIHTSRDTYKSNSTFDPDLARERAERKAQNALQEIKSKQWIQENSLSIEDRDKLYSQLFDELTLDSGSSEDLRARGLTNEEIEKSGFKSYQYGQELKGDYPESLPGIKDGNRLNCGDGTVIPCKDFDGRIAGFQVRSHKKTSDGNRYRWGSNGNGLLRLQPENENPLAVYHPDTPPVGIAIIEGTGAKPFFVAQRLGYLVVGAAGGLWLSSEKFLKKYITQAFDKYGDLPITVFPDAGFGLNPKVSEKIRKLIEWLQGNTSVKPDEVLVADWNQITKIAGDIDEISDLSCVRYLKASSFLKKYKQVFENGKKFKNWGESRVRLTADITQNERWVSIPRDITQSCDILLIRAGLGQGKTQDLLEFLKYLGVFTILEGYRNSLINQTVARSNEIGYKAMHIKDSSESIKGCGVIDHTLDESIRLVAGCADSYHKLERAKERNPNYYFAADEILSLLLHLKTGGTLGKRRRAAIDWTVSAIEESQFAIMMDANLSDVEVDFIKKLFPNKRIKVLDNIFATSPRNFYFVETKSDKSDFSTNGNYLPSHLIEMAKKCQRLLWISDSQRSCEVSDKIITKLDLKTFRLDGKTSLEDISKIFLDNPKLFIETEQIEALMLSPSAESGLSIPLFGYFDSVFFDVRGTVGVNTLVQLSARLRDTEVPIYVSCPEFANLSQNKCPYPHKEIQKVFEERGEMMSAMVAEADPTAIDSDFIINMITSVALDAIKDLWTIESLKDSIKLVHEHRNLKLYLKTALQQAGNIIHDLVVGRDEEIEEEAKTTKEEVMMLEAKKIYESVDLTKEQLERYEKQENNYDIQCAVRKAQLKQRLPGIELSNSWTPEFIYTVLLKNKEFLGGFWELQKLKSQELLNSEVKNNLKGKIEYGLSALDIWNNRNTREGALKSLGLLNVIEAESFSIKQENIRKIVDDYYSEEGYFNLIGITKAEISKKQPGKHIKVMLNKFLDVFGLETEDVAKNNSERWYRVCVPPEIKPYLVDIEASYLSKAEKIINEAKNLDLKTLAEKHLFTTGEVTEEKTALIPEALEDVRKLSPVDAVEDVVKIVADTKQESPFSKMAATEQPNKEALLASYADYEGASREYSIGQYVEVFYAETMKMEVGKVLDLSTDKDKFFCKIEFLNQPLDEKEKTFYDSSEIFFSPLNDW